MEMSRTPHTSKGMPMQTTTLRNGIEMPLEGFGVFQVPDATLCEQAVSEALAAGYRLIDTASVYRNEEAVGAAVRKSGIPRKELFITTKVWIQEAGYEKTKEAFEASLNRLGLDTLDLYLIHMPFGDYYGSWRAMEELYEDGRIRAIGVCNFLPDRLMDLCRNASIPPMLNQVEMHPFCQQKEALDVMRECGVQPQAWAPFAEGMRGIFRNGLLCAIGQILIDRTKLTPARILVAYVVAGVLLGAVGLYDKLVDFAGAGATVPLTGFGNTLARGVKKAVDEDGALGILTGGLTASAAGITAAVLFGLLASFIFKPKDK